MPISQLKLQDDLRRYLCLRCAGFLEQVTYTILTEFLEQKSSSPIIDFTKSYFSRAPNLNYHAYVDLIGRFGDSYQEQFEELLSQGGRKESLDDLLSVRNDVAHGKYQGGQKLQPDRYVLLCEDIFDWLVSTFLGNSVEIFADDGKTRIGTTQTANN
jgi:hypothetical protein